MQRPALGDRDARGEIVSTPNLSRIGGDGKIPGRVVSSGWRLAGRLIAGQRQRGTGDHDKRNKWFKHQSAQSAAQRVDGDDERRAQAGHHETDLPAPVAGETTKREPTEEEHEEGDAT